MIKTSLLSLALLLNLSSEVLAGSETHGGSAIVCRDRRGGIISTELTDSYEQGDLRLLPEETSETEVFNNALDRLDFRPDLQMWFQETFIRFQDWTKLSAEPLPLVRDLGNAKALGHRCEYQQLAVFDGTHLLVDSELYNALPRRDRAGLIVHEAIYYIARNFKGVEITDSSWSRKVTGELLSQRNVPDAEALLQTALAQITFRLLPGVYRIGDCRVSLSFDYETPSIRLYTGRVSRCASLGITQNETMLLLNWKTGEYYSNAGQHLVPGLWKFDLDAHSFDHSGFFWSNNP